MKLWTHRDSSPEPADYEYSGLDCFYLCWAKGVTKNDSSEEGMHLGINTPLTQRFLNELSFELQWYLRLLYIVENLMIST